MKRRRQSSCKGRKSFRPPFSNQRRRWTPGKVSVHPFQTSGGAGPRDCQPSSSVKSLAKEGKVSVHPFQRVAESRGAGLRWRPLPKAEAPTEPAGKTGVSGRAPQSAKHFLTQSLRRGRGPPSDRLHNFPAASGGVSVSQKKENFSDASFRLVTPLKRTTT